MPERRKEYYKYKKLNKNYSSQKPKTKLTNTSFCLPRHLLDWAHGEAESRGQSLSEYIRALILIKWDADLNKDRQNNRSNEHKSPTAEK